MLLGHHLRVVWLLLIILYVDDDDDVCFVIIVCSMDGWIFMDIDELIVLCVFVSFVC